MKEYFKKLKYLFKLRDLVFAVMLIGIMVLLAFCNGQNMIDVTFGDTALDVVTNRYSMNIPYDMVESIELGEVDPDDELIAGKGDIALMTGHCRNEAWGEYYGVIDRQTGKCILIRLNDGRLFVFSHKSDDQVLEDFNTLQSHLNK